MTDDRELCECPRCGRNHWKLGNPPWRRKESMKEFIRGFIGSLTAAGIIISYFEYSAHRDFERNEAQLSKMLGAAVDTCDAKKVSP